jgi:hypothetical protein
VKWKLIVTAGAIAGVALAAKRRQHKAVVDGERWAAATDPVTPLGNA